MGWGKGFLSTPAGMGRRGKEGGVCIETFGHKSSSSFCSSPSLGPRFSITFRREGKKGAGVCRKRVGLFPRVCPTESLRGQRKILKNVCLEVPPPLHPNCPLTLLSKRVKFSAKKGVAGDVTPSPDQIRLSSPQSHHPLYAGGILRPRKRGRVDVCAPSPPLFPHYEAI